MSWQPESAWAVVFDPLPGVRETIRLYPTMEAAMAAADELAAQGSCHTSVQEATIYRQEQS